MSYGVRHTACSEQLKRSSSDPANVPLSKPGETNGFGDCRVTSAAVTLRTLETALCARRRRHYVAERQSIVGFAWAAEGKQNPDSTVMAAVQTEPQCSLARTSRYCVTL